jgi:ComEC/Rec2-related protein
MTMSTEFLTRPLRAFPGFTNWLLFPGFVGWIGFSAGIATGYCLLRAVLLPPLLYDAVFPSAIVLLVCAGLLLARPWARFTSFFFAGAAAVGLSICGQQVEYHRAGPFLSGNVHATLSGTVISSPEMSNGSLVFLVKSDSLSSKNRASAFRHRVIECRSPCAPCIAGRVVLAGHFIPPRPALNPGSFDDYLYCMSRGVWGRLYCDSIVSCRENFGPWQKLAAYARHTVFRAASHIKNSDFRAIIVAAFLNDRSDISDSMKGLFFKAGIYHLLALSGFNVAIVAGALFALLLLVPVPRAAKAGIVLVFVWAYLFFIGPIPSLFRAVVMTSIVMLSFLFQRRPHLLNSLGIAGLVWLLFSPVSLLTPGYQLSFCATAGIALLHPVFVRQWNDLPGFPAKKILSPLAVPFSVSCSAFLATAPVLAFHFGTLSLSGIVVNLFAVFLMSVSMWISMTGFLLQIVFPPLVPLVMAAAEWCVRLMIESAEVISSLQLSTVQLPRLVPAAYVLFAVFLLGICTVRLEFVRRYICIAGICLAAAVAALTIWQWQSAAPQVVFFQIKKSHCAAVRWPNHKVWIAGLDGKGISVATYPRVIEPWLRQTPGPGIDCIALSDDPCNSVQTVEPLLIGNPVSTIITAEGSASTCPDFIQFAREFGVSCSTAVPRSVFSPSPRCSLILESPVPGEKAGIYQRFVVKMGKATLSFDDSLTAPSETRGAATVTFCSSGLSRLKYAVPCWHPLVAVMCNEKGFAGMR